MIDISKISYRLILLDETGKQYDLKDIIQDLGWEENENELAARISFKLADLPDLEPKARELCRNGRKVFLMAGSGSVEAEACRGTLKTWQNSYSFSARSTECMSYDMLHQLDKSQDNKHISSGRSTRQIFEEIAADWGIPIADYRGPDVLHGKTDFKNKSPANMFLELLDDAKKKGAGEFVIRAVQDRIQVLPVLSNETVYVFQKNNSIQMTHKQDISDMVTKVKVLGQSKKTGNAPVEAVVEGKTEFGILQRIYQRNSDETLADAKQAASQILEEDGSPNEEIALNLPDVPFVRKGDAIYCDQIETANGYYRVLSVSHDCDQKTMTVKIKKAEGLNAAAGNLENPSGAGYEVGAEVTFLGGMHYVSSDAGAKGYAVKGSGKAKITKIAEGKGHPYHLIHSDSSCTVYGWVDRASFQ